MITNIELHVEIETRNCAAHVIDRLSQLDDTMCGPFFNYDAAYDQIAKGFLAELEAVSGLRVPEYEVGEVFIDPVGVPVVVLVVGANELRLRMVL